MKLTVAKADLIVRTLCIPAILGLVVTTQYCTRHMPEVANPEIGRTIPFQGNYGKTVYLTGTELHYVHLVYATAIGLGAVALAVFLLNLWQALKEGMHEKA